jgi:hypothetical protein
MKSEDVGGYPLNSFEWPAAMCRVPPERYGMANADHLKLLREGTDSWNAWRQANPSIKPNLAGAELRGASLQNGDLRRSELRGVDFHTHYHLDHVGANAVFADAGAMVLAHRNVRGWVHSENLRMFGRDIKPQQKTFIDALVPPTVTYDQPVDLYLGSRAIRVRSFPGDSTSWRQTPS